ncbi:MAG: hypothetical protein AAFW97_13895 [Pseudomonadota bacterium]
MKSLNIAMTAGALIGLAGSGFAQPRDPGTLLWTEVCGRPGMRIAIDLGADDREEDRRDCAEACHAALCRKTIDTLKKGDGEGAAV